MSLSKKILSLWLGTVFVLLATLFLPHWEFTVAAFVIYSLHLLLFIISIFLVKHEATKKNKWIFVNFAAFFSMSVFYHAYNFVGTLLFADQPMARHYYFQYVSQGLYFFLLVFAICYITVDLLFRDFRSLQKYLITFAIVGGFFGYYYHPYFTNPDYLYQTDEIAEWREVDRAYSAFAKVHKTDPAPSDLAAALASSNTVYGRLNAADRLARVQQMFPYLGNNSNYMILLLKPIYLNAIYMCVLSVALVLLFFGYMYRKDPPQGAYIEKMMFTFLMLVTLEIFHAWSVIKAIEWESFSEIITVGQYLTAFVLMFVVLFFALRLRFLNSVNGEFYEQEIAASPTQVTRWRDALDNMVIAHFLDRNELAGRFLVNPKNKQQATSS